VQNDPVSFTDPSGLEISIWDTLDGSAASNGFGGWGGGGFDINYRPRRGPDILREGENRIDGWMNEVWYGGGWTGASACINDPEGSGRCVPAGSVSYIDGNIPGSFNSSGSTTGYAPRRSTSTDGDAAAVNGGIGTWSVAASIGEYWNQFNGMWRGANGQWYRLGWGGNQYAGARALALGRANKYRLLGRAAFGLTAVFSGTQAYQNLRQGNYRGAAKNGLDIGMAYVGVAGGLPGAAISGGYFVVDTFVGWDNVGTALTVPCDAACRRK
jgi:hypothetical protein